MSVVISNLNYGTSPQNYGQIPSNYSNTFSVGNKIQIGQPSAPYKPFIRYYKYLESDLTGIFKGVPNTYVELYFNFTKISLYSPGKYDLDHPRVFLTGLHQYDQDIYSHMLGTGRKGGFVIVFQPQGFFDLFSVKISDFYRFTLDGGSVFKKDIYNLWEELQAFPDIEGMIKLVENYLSAFVRKASGRPGVINKIVNYMDICNGMSRVSQLCNLFNVTPRSLTRHFKDEIGISPKELLNIFRINNAIRLIRNEPDCDLTGISYLCGYYDQSHFIKEIKKITGLPPGRIRGSETKVEAVHNLLFVKSG